MLSVTRVDHRRVLVLGLAGLVPAALVTLLLVHQPSIGDRRLYPLLRGPLAFVGLALALVAAVIWATTPPRITRSSLCGLAWAGVTTILCIGPLLESTPRARLYAIELTTGDVEWTTSRAGSTPALVGDDLVVTGTDGSELIGLDPATGDERWRRGRIRGGFGAGGRAHGRRARRRRQAGGSWLVGAAAGRAGRRGRGRRRRCLRLRPVARSRRRRRARRSSPSTSPMARCDGRASLPSRSPRRPGGDDRRFGGRRRRRRWRAYRRSRRR